MAFAALMISLIRGTPRVTFIDATPAKWNVFKVICVPGSPIDCAPTAPTVDPKIVITLVKYGNLGKKSTRFNFCLNKFRPTGCQKVSQLLLGDSRCIVDTYHGHKWLGETRIVNKGSLLRLPSSVPRCVPFSSPLGRPRWFRIIAKGVIMCCSANARTVPMYASEHSTPKLGRDNS